MRWRGGFAASNLAHCVSDHGKYGRDAGISICRAHCQISPIYSARRNPLRRNEPGFLAEFLIYASSLLMSGDRNCRCAKQKQGPTPHDARDRLGHLSRILPLPNFIWGLARYMVSIPLEYRIWVNGSALVMKVHPCKPSSRKRTLALAPVARRIGASSPLPMHRWRE